MADEGAVAEPAGDDDGISPERGVADAGGTGGPGMAGGGLPAGGPLGDGTAGAGPAGNGPAGGAASPVAGGPAGDERVDAVIARLGELAETPLEQHVAFFGQVHDRLREVLGELDAGAPGTGAHEPEAGERPGSGTLSPPAPGLPR